MSILKANRIENLTTTDGGISINNSGQVGIGTESPASLLHLNTDGTALRVTRGSCIGFLYNTGTSSTDTTRLQGNSGPVELYTNAAQPIKVVVNGTEEARFLSGGGLTFNGDTAAANALSDYEEGTWTPAISNTGFTFTYSRQEGVYTKVGRLVTLRWYITVTARSGSSSGGIPIINVPLTTDGLNDSGSYFYPLPTQIIVHKAGNTSSSGTKTLLMAGFANSNTANFWINNPNITGTTAFDMGSAFHIGGVVTYTSNA